MRNFALLSLILLGVSACGYDTVLRPINLGPLIHDTNSKVWFVDQIISGNKNFAPKNIYDKDVVIFYESGNCVFQPMKTIGEIPSKKGQFTLFSEDQTITLYFQKEKWDFKITTFSKDTLILSPTELSDLKYELVLLPFPEL